MGERKKLLYPLQHRPILVTEFGLGGHPQITGREKVLIHPAKHVVESYFQRGTGNVETPHIQWHVPISKDIRITQRDAQT